MRYIAPCCGLCQVGLSARHHCGGRVNVDAGRDQLGGKPEPIRVHGAVRTGGCVRFWIGHQTVSGLRTFHRERVCEVQVAGAVVHLMHRAVYVGRVKIASAGWRPGPTQ